jgi:MoaD family protein
MPPTSTRRPASAVLLLFAAAREAAGVGKENVDAATVGEVIEAARVRHGDRFSEIVDRSRIWLNGEPVDADHPLRDGDEVAVLPPVSGGGGR